MFMWCSHYFFLFLDKKFKLGEHKFNLFWGVLFDSFTFQVQSLINCSCRPAATSIGTGTKMHFIDLYIYELK